MASTLVPSGLALLLVFAPGLPVTRAIAAEFHGGVAVIVGPVGPSLTPTYISLADEAVAAAERQGASVRRAYSPDATPEQVVAAVEGADVIVYFGHGTGYPNPYSDTLNPETANGWGLQGPNARGDHSDSLADGTLAYYGEAWIAEHARPAPGFVLIYSNVCYAPGAGEGHDAPSTPEVAAQRAGGYARTPLAMGASAVFATDYYAGAATLVSALLSRPEAPYGAIFAADPRFEAAGLSTQPHPYADGAELWLHRSAYFGGKVDYWYAFSGDPAASFAIGRAGGLSVARSFEPARAGTLLGGVHDLVRLGPDGAIAERRRLRLEAATPATFTARETRDGLTWLQLAAPEAGWWLAESPAAALTGVAAEAPLAPPRELELAPGTYAGHRFDAAGRVVGAASLTPSPAARLVADREAIVNGQAYLRVADGQLAGYWLARSEALRLGAPVLPPPSAEAASGSPPPVALPAPTPTPLPSPSLPAPPAPPTPSPTLEPTPRPSQAPPPPGSPPTPSPTPMPSSSPAPSLTPTPVPPTPLPTPTPTAAPSPSEEAGPAPTP